MACDANETSVSKKVILWLEFGMRSCIVIVQHWCWAITSNVIAASYLISPAVSFMGPPGHPMESNWRIHGVDIVELM
jgi:hypothetical protein